MSKAEELLRKVMMFHVGRISFVKSLDKKSKDSYHELMVEIYEYFNDKKEERKDIYGNTIEKT